jgi:solute carrier family 35 protein F5
MPQVGEVGVQAPVNARLGDFLALLSAFCYAVYVTLLKLRIKSEDRVSMPLFFGFVGAFNILAMWPVGLGLHLTGWETFQLPSDTKTWIGVGVNMGIKWGAASVHCDC